MHGAAPVRSFGFSLFAACSLTFGGCADDAGPVRLDPSPAPEVLVDVEQAARGRLSEAIPRLPARTELRTKGIDVDELGRSHVRFQQTVDDVPVFGADLVAHLDEQGDLLGVTDALLRDVRVNTTPSIDEDVAVSTAHASIAPRLVRSENIKSRLVVHGEDTLAWEVRMELLDEPEVAAVPVVFVDAHSGSILWSYDSLMKSWLEPVSSNGFGSTTYDGDRQFNAYLHLDDQKYYHEDIVRGIATLDFGGTTTTMNWKPSDEAIFADQQMNEAHWAAGRYFDFIRDRFGRTNLPGLGKTPSHAPGIGNLVTLATSYGNGINDAKWTGTYALFSGGDGVTRGSFAALDVVGHELTHALVQITSNILYNGESGGLNESMADVMAAGLEAYHGNTGSDVWWMGEDVLGNTGWVVRTFIDPAADGSSLDFYSGLASLSDVHHSSGIGNLAFYLTAVGGSHPRRTTTPITGIGMDDALQIWHMAMSFYLPTQSTYHDARKGTLDAATYLHGANSAQVRAVADAWTTVGVYPCSTAWQKSNRTWRRGETVYYPSSSGFIVEDGQTLVASLVDVTTATAANLDLFLETKPAIPKGRFARVAASEQTITAEHIAYTTMTGPLQARWVVKAKAAAASNMELCADAR